MLWSDRKLIVTQADLAELDSDISTIISIERTAANRIIAQAIQEAAIYVQSMMQSAGPIVYPGGLTAGHIQAVLSTTAGGSLEGVNSPRVAMSQVVITAVKGGMWSPLKSWLAYRSMAAIMRDVCERKDNDRYKVKWDRIEAHLANTAEPMLRNNGMPILGQPLASPAAELEPDTGEFTGDDLSGVAADGAIGGSYDVAVSWTASGYVGPLDRRNAESCPSVRANITLAEGEALGVSIARLRPPDGTLHEAYQNLGLTLMPRAATGWNIWVGNAGGRLILQNPAPIPVATKSYALASDPAIVGPVEHEGQYVEASLTIARSFFRG